MKKTIAMMCAGFIGLQLMATDVQLIVQKIDNQGIVPGQTYRLYAQVLDANKNIHAVFGDTQNPLVITSTAPFYQHPFGGYSALNLMSDVVAVAPELNYDSWITLSYDNSDGNDMWDIGISFEGFDNGQSLNVDNGAWFLLPTNPRCNAGANGLILLGQFTTSGIASGSLNVQGWNGPNVNWQARGLTFSTTNAQVFGCTDAQASNYNAAATFNDGTCVFNNNGHNNDGLMAEHTEAAADAVKADNTQANNWEVFPNPIRQSALHIQFKNAIELGNSNALVEIYDTKGKRVNRFEITQAMMNGNRVTLNQSLAAGTYKVVLTHNGTSESKSIIVER